MLPELRTPTFLQDVPTMLPHLARLRERLATDYLAPLLDAPCQAWYLRAVALSLVQQLLDLYRRRVLTMVQEQGSQALPRATRQAVTVTTTVTGALTIQIDLGTVTDPVPAPLAQALAQRYQTSSWRLLAQRLALDLTAVTLESLQQTLGAEAVLAMSETVFTEIMLAAVLQATPSPFPNRVRHRLEVQAQYDALDLAGLIEPRGPSLVELEYLLGLQHNPARSARLLALLRQEHLTVLSAAHYHALRTALAHNTFHEVEGIPWPTAPLVTGPARGHAELRPLIADTTAWLAPEIVEAWAQRMWQQRGELSDLDADVLDALSALWLRHARTPDEDAVAAVDDLLALRGLQPKQRGHGRRSGYEPEQRQAVLRALTHLQNLWLHITELELYLPSPAGARRRRRTTQEVQSRLFTMTDWLGHTRPDGWFEMEKFIFRPGKVLAHFLHGPGRQTALLSACALSYDPYRQRWEKRLLRYLSWQWRTRAHGGHYGQTYRVDTLFEAIGEEVGPRRIAWQKARLEKAFDTIETDGGLGSWHYQDLNLDTWWLSTVLFEPPEIIRTTYEHLAPQDLRAPRALPAAPALGERLQRRRLALGLSQIRAAEQLDISQAYLSLIERGTKTRLSVHLQRKIRVWLGENTEATPQL
jgi:hypothetical protein